MDKRILKLILKADLEENEIDLWEKTFGQLPAEDRKKLENVITEYPEFIRPFTANLTKKADIFAHGGAAGWRNLLEEENAQLAAF